LRLTAPAQRRLVSAVSSRDRWMAARRWVGEATSSRYAYQVLAGCRRSPRVRHGVRLGLERLGRGPRGRGWHGGDPVVVAVCYSSPTSTVARGSAGQRIGADHLRPVLDAAATILRSGQPYFPSNVPDKIGAPYMSAAQMRRMVAAGGSGTGPRTMRRRYSASSWPQVAVNPPISPPVRLASRGPVDRSTATPDGSCWTVTPGPSVLIIPAGPQPVAFTLRAAHKSVFALALRIPGSTRSASLARLPAPEQRTRRVVVLRHRGGRPGGPAGRRRSPCAGYGCSVKARSASPSAVKARARLRATARIRARPAARTLVGEHRVGGPRGRSWEGVGRGRPDPLRVGLQFLEHRPGQPAPGRVAGVRAVVRAGRGRDRASSTSRRPDRPSRSASRAGRHDVEGVALGVPGGPSS